LWATRAFADVAPLRPRRHYRSTGSILAAANAPAGIEVEVRLIHTAPATLAPTDHPAISTAARALEEVWGSETVFIRSGGSIPVVGDFQEHLGIPTALMGYGLPDDALHAPNEKFSLRNFHMGIASTARFLELLGQAECN